MGERSEQILLTIPEAQLHEVRIVEPENDR